MSSFSTKIINKDFIINLLFSSLIVSFIIGNLILNLNLVLIIITSIFFFKKKIIPYEFDFFDKVLITLFTYILLCSALNNIYYYKDGSVDNFSIFLKSVLFLRFLIFYFVVKFLIKEDIINFKIFFVTSLTSVVFVCVDIIYQLIFGYDIFGYKAIERRLSGPFGDELIAGSFIQRFSLISLFLIPIYFKFKKNYSKYIFTLILICLFLVTLILSGNRIPLVFFILTISAIIIFEKKLRKLLLPFILITFSIIFLAYNSSENYRNHFHSFAKKTVGIFLPLASKNLLTSEDVKKYENYQFYTFQYKGKQYKMTNSHLKEFKTGYMTWLDRKFFGGGIKSFKINCPKAQTINCGSHPHNYYLEILSNLGLFGFSIIFILFSFIFIKIFIKKYFRNSILKSFHLITPFIFLLFSEIFPIKSTGSFFSTGNATYIFLLISIIIPLSKVKKLD
jgi:O-antigen ligase